MSTEGQGLFGTISGAAAAVNPIFGAVGAIAGFFGARSERKRKRREARARKMRAIKSEDLLMGAAQNVAGRMREESKFLQNSFNLEQTSALQQYGQTLDQAESQGGFSNLAGSGAVDKSMSQIATAFQQEREASQLGFDRDRTRLAQETESQLRDIEGNLIELSAYSGRKKSVLGAYNNRGGN